MLLSIFQHRPHLSIRRRCPDCALPMGSYQCENAIVERCFSCNGVWFDEREIGQFRAGLEKLDLKALKLELPVAASSQIILSTCPICQVQLTESQYAYNSRVATKRCEKCQGLWLSGSEVIKFADFVHVCQAIASDVKGLAREQRKAISSSENMRNLVGAATGKLSVHQRATMLAHSQFGHGLILPLYDETSRDAFPWVTLGLIALNTFIFFFTGYDLVIWNALGIVPAELWKNGGWIALFSSQYLHGGVLHLLGNCFFLWLFGDNVEDKLGKLRYFIFYTLTGIAAGLAYIIANPDSAVPAIGASGAISGILGAYFVLFPRAVIHTLIFGQIFRLHIAFYLVVWIGWNIGIGWRGYMQGANSVAWVAHLAGFVAGIAFMHLFRIRKVPAT